MHQFGPAWIVEPKRRGAFGAEIAFTGAGFAAAAFVQDLGAEYADCLFAPYLKAVGFRRQVDRKTTAACRLAADGTVAKLIRMRRMAEHREMHSAAAAGAFQFQRHDSPETA